jgi:hypothetical protein
VRDSPSERVAGFFSGYPFFIREKTSEGRFFNRPVFRKEHFFSGAFLMAGL